MQILIIGSNPETKSLLALLQTLDSVEPVIMHTDDDYTETYRDMAESVLPYYIDDRFYDFDEFIYYMDMIKDMLRSSMENIKLIAKSPVHNVVMQAKQHTNRVNIPVGYKARRA